MILFADIVRVFVLLGGALVVGIALIVVRDYARIYLAHRRSGEAKWRGLLPLHVAMIGTSYLLFVVGVLSEAVGRLHQPLTWRAPVYLVATYAGAYALWAILSSTRHRKADMVNHTTG